MKEDYDDFESEEVGIYDDEFIEELKENDEIDDFEEAFMKGYNGEPEEDLELPKKKK